MLLELTNVVRLEREESGTTDCILTVPLELTNVVHLEREESCTLDHNLTIHFEASRPSPWNIMDMSVKLLFFLRFCVGFENYSI